jgi:5-methylcytosine-specific restriction enzyme subunit McrC
VTVEQKRILPLKEWEPTDVELTSAELAELQSLTAAKLTIAPGIAAGRYVVRPSSVVGSATTSSVQVVIEPKVGVERVFYLLGYARQLPFLHESVDLGSRADLVEAFAASFLTVLQRSLRRGLLMGYVAQEDALPLVRGQIRFAEQVRRRHGLPLPIEVAYDDYTVDTEANRLIKAALRRLSYVRFRRSELRARVNEALGAFATVSDVVYQRTRLPQFTYTRLTERYRAPLELARLLVRNASVELEEGRVQTLGILFDMNDVFEDFLFAAVGDELAKALAPAYKWRHGRSVVLDVDGRLRPEPDLSLWRGRECVFVGDAKYKETERGEVDDLYQLLAYCVATGLPEGLLVYADARTPMGHQVVLGGPRLHVESVDLALPRAALMARCREIAGRVRALAKVDE